MLSLASMIVRLGLVRCRCSRCQKQVKRFGEMNKTFSRSDDSISRLYKHLSVSIKLGCTWNRVPLSLLQVICKAPISFMHFPFQNPESHSRSPSRSGELSSSNIDANFNSDSKIDTVGLKMKPKNVISNVH